MQESKRDHYLSKVDEMKRLQEERAHEREESHRKYLEAQKGNKKALHKRMQQDYELNFEAPMLEAKKKQLESIREFNKPVNQQGISDHI